MLRAYVDDLWWVLGLLVAIAATAALINKFRPIHRPRIRRLATIYALFVTATGAAIGFAAAGLPAWANGCAIAAEILQAFTLVSLGATLAFALLLPSISIDLPMIASDLLVGLGYVVVTLAILSRHGVNPTGALVSGAVVSAVLAISLQSTLGNIVGGVALQLDGSIREGDWIQLDNGRQGRVRAVRWRHTVLETRDWTTIVVPNAQLLGNAITLLGKRDGRTVPTRLWIYFNVDFRVAPQRVIRVVDEALQASPIENVAADPVANAVCLDFAKPGQDSFATYGVRFWIQDLSSNDSTTSRVRVRIYTALQRAQIPLAVPAQTQFVELKDEARAQRRLERAVDERFAALKNVHLFRTLTDEELHTLAAGMTHVLYTHDEVITRQGAIAHWLYIMTSGTAEIRAHLDDLAPATNGHAASTNGHAANGHAANGHATNGHATNGAANGHAANGHAANGAANGHAANGHAANGAAKPAPSPHEKTRIAQISAPDFFGEMSLMTGEPRSADVIAVGDVDCFRLGRDTFKTVLLARPEIADELSTKLATRRIELLAAREGLTGQSRTDREASERARILRGIRSFFALG